MKITEERVAQILPQNIKNSGLLSDLEKRTLAALMHSQLIAKGAQESGFLVIGDKKLSSIVGGRYENIITALRTLEEYDLFERKVGKPRVEGEKSKASEYHFNWDNIFDKPLKKKTSEELFSKYRKSLETSMGTANTITNTITNTTSITITKPTTTTIENTITNTSIEDFIQMVDEELVGESKDELLEKRIDIQRMLTSERTKIGENKYNRSLSYLNRKYKEAVASI